MARGRVRRFECRNLPGHSHVRHGAVVPPTRHWFHGDADNLCLCDSACKAVQHESSFKLYTQIRFTPTRPRKRTSGRGSRDALPPRSGTRRAGAPVRLGPPFDTPAKRERRGAWTRVWTSDMCTRSSLRVSLTGVRRVGVSVCAPPRAVEPRRFAHNLLAPLLHAGQFGLTYLSSGAPPQARGALLAYGGKELRWERAPELCG